MDRDGVGSSAIPSAPASGAAVYQRTDEFEQEDFAGELLVVQPQTQTSLMLNAAAAALWEALRWPQTAAELVEMLREARPLDPPEAAAQQVEDVLAHLRDAGLVFSTAPASR